MQDAVIEVEIPSRVDLVAVVRMVVAAASNAVDALHGDRLDDLRLVVSEATTNAIEANQTHREGVGRVLIRCEAHPGMVRLRISDQGAGLPDPDDLTGIDTPARLDVEGGFGIPLMRELSDLATFVSGPSGTTVDLVIRQD
jgi:anti-sigma regulatory factor (Ser/Thr protein kinase)